VIPYLGESTVYADFNTASPAVKASLAQKAAEAGIRFADVAVLAPVNRAGSKTALMTSGTGAERTAELLRPFEVPIEVIPGEAGTAASRKLLRSVFMKGLAGLVLETVAAGAAAGNESWIRDQMAAELGPDGHALVERLITGSHAHAVRRTHEIEDALDYVRQLGTPAWMTEGALAWLSSLAEGRG
jgi:3-hydroxyisobutyrate dehydrogenase-like beta-hydroxyacid dehydrogenase